MANVKDEIKERLFEAKQDYKEVGGWSSFKSGQWLWHIIQKSFSNYWKNANVEYFESKYGTKDAEKLAKKLISVAAKNAAILGGITGAAISAKFFIRNNCGGIGQRTALPSAKRAVALVEPETLTDNFKLNLSAEAVTVHRVSDA